jgi:hypothetical protein
LDVVPLFPELEDLLLFLVRSAGGDSSRFGWRHTSLLLINDRFKFFFHPDGVIILPKIPTVRLKGIIPKPAKPIFLEEIDRAIESGATQRFRRKK